MLSTAHAKLIQMVHDSTYFIDMVDLCATFDEESKSKYT